MDNTLICSFILFWNKCIFEHKKKTDRTNLYFQYLIPKDIRSQNLKRDVMSYSRATYLIL